MPKVFLNEEKRMSERLASWVYGQMKLQGVTQKELAGEMDITQPALSYKLRTRQFSYKDFLVFIKVFQPEPSELAWLVGNGGKYERKL